MSQTRVEIKITKRSVTFGGRKTSVSLEDAFWDRLKMIAESGGRSVSALVAVIREQHAGRNLSSACRLYVLADALGRQS